MAQSNNFSVNNLFAGLIRLASTSPDTDTLLNWLNETTGEQFQRVGQRQDQSSNDPESNAPQHSSPHQCNSNTQNTDRELPSMQEHSQLQCQQQNHSQVQCQYKSKGAPISNEAMTESQTSQQAQSQVHHQPPCTKPSNASTIAQDTLNGEQALELLTQAAAMV